eukprot:TRINITY_DN3129_c0_g1_i1.p1 TRINITY_DN3129_c0_g1~~TRINITY_DN3129_c0_g1_i1.p1  ORF type:complete len:778 (+),score=206.07 TRINITY_DN3129_c0_g1_i1:91-2424(+)
MRQGHSASPAPGALVLLRCVIGAAKGLPIGCEEEGAPGQVVVKVAVGQTIVATSPKQPTVGENTGALNVCFQETVDVPVPGMAGGRVLPVTIRLTSPTGEDHYGLQSLLEVDYGSAGRQWLTLRPSDPAAGKAFGEVFIQWSFAGTPSPHSISADAQGPAVGRWPLGNAPPRTCSAPVCPPQAPMAVVKSDPAKARVHFNDLWAHSTRKGRAPSVGADGLQGRDDSAERLPGPGTLRLRIKAVRLHTLPQADLRSLTLVCSYGGTERHSQSVLAPNGWFREGADVQLEFEADFDVVYSATGRKLLFFSLWGQAKPVVSSAGAPRPGSGDRAYEDLRLGDGVFELANLPPAAQQTCTLNSDHTITFAYRVTYQRPLQEGSRGRPKSAHPNAKKAPKHIAGLDGETDLRGAVQQPRPQSAQSVSRPLSAGKPERLRREIAGVHDVLQFSTPRRDEGDERPRSIAGVGADGIDTGCIQMDFGRPQAADAMTAAAAAAEEASDMQVDARGAENCGPPPLLPPCETTADLSSGEDSPVPGSPPPLITRAAPAWSPPLPTAQPPQPPQHNLLPAGTPMKAVFSQLRRDLHRQLALMEERLSMKLDSLGTRVARLESFVDDAPVPRHRQDSSGLPTTSSPTRSRPASCQSRPTSSNRPWSGGSNPSVSVRAASPIGHLGPLSRPSSSGTSTGDGTPPPNVLQAAADLSGSIVTDDQLRTKFEELAGPGRVCISFVELRRFYRSFDSFGIDETDEQVGRKLAKFCRTDQVSFNEFAHLALSLAKR